MIFSAYTDSEMKTFGLAVKSGGHIFATNGREINRPDGRRDWLLFYIAKGSETFYHNGKQTAQAGSFIIFAPGEKQHHICESNETSEFYYLHFTVDESFDLPWFETSVIYQTRNSVGICELFEQTINEMQTRLACYESICVMKLAEILAMLKRKIENEKSGHHEYINRITSVLRRMNCEYYDCCSLDEYAAMCNMSKYHFLRVFESITGRTPIEYRNCLRIEHAKELLEDTDSPISEIGLRLGYSSSSYFCDAFRKETGISPSTYRKQARRKG